MVPRVKVASYGRPAPSPFDETQWSAGEKLRLYLRASFEFSYPTVVVAPAA